MKKIILTLMTLLLSASLFAENLTGYEVMKKADQVPEAKTSSSTASLTIHSKKGSDRIREVIMKSKDYGDMTKEVIVFTSPKDVSGVGYLMFEYKEDEKGNKKDSDNWLYMTAMKKTRRIASSGSESEGSFMGTDFTYQDMGERSLNKYEYTLLGEENINGTDCYKGTPVEGKVVTQTSVGNVCKLAQSGEVDVAFVYTSDVYRFGGVKIVGTVAGDTHKNIVYPGAVCTQSKYQEEAQAFLDWCLTDPEALKIWQKWGFELA